MIIGSEDERERDPRKMGSMICGRNEDATDGLEEVGRTRGRRRCSTAMLES